jgi:hypothetical protein
MDNWFQFSPMQPGCPWHDLHTQFPPNVDWCEEKVCSLILTPNNAWTNLAYLLIGWMMLRRTRHQSNEVLKFFGKAAILVGSFSFLYHISLNAFTQIFDFLGMYLFCFILIQSNLSRSGNWPDGRAGRIRFWQSVIGLTLVTIGLMLVHFPIQSIIGVLLGVIVFTEFRQKTASRKNFWISIVFITVAAVFSVLDVKRILCWPENHWFQAHGIWHITSAISLWFAFRHAEEAART